MKKGLIILLIALSFTSVACSNKNEGTSAETPKTEASDTSSEEDSKEESEETSSTSKEVLSHKFLATSSISLEGSSSDGFKKVLPVKDGFVALGKSASNDGDFKDFNSSSETTCFISKFDNKGKNIFITPISGYKNLEIVSMSIDKKDDIILLGHYSNNIGPEGVLLKFSNSGKLVFSKTIKDVTTIHKLTVLEDNSYLVSGQATGLDKKGDFKDMPNNKPNFFMTFDSNGNKKNLVYDAIYSLNQNIVSTTDGGFILGITMKNKEGGFTPDTAISDDYVIVSKFNKDLKKEWSNSYGSPTYTLSDIITINNEIFTLSYSSKSTNSVITKINNKGEKVFEKPIDLKYTFPLSSLTVDEKGNIYVIGTVTDSSILGADDISDTTSILKLDSTGNFLFGEAINIERFSGSSITISSDKEIIVAGSSKYDPSAATLLKFKEK